MVLNKSPDDGQSSFTLHQSDEPLEEAQTSSVLYKEVSPDPSTLQSLNKDLQNE